MLFSSCYFVLGMIVTQQFFWRDSQKYESLDIDSTNVMEFYQFIFSKELKQVIKQTNAEMLFQKGIPNKVVPGLTLIIFPKEYKLKVRCPNDENLRLYIIYKKDNWRIAIGGG